MTVKVSGVIRKLPFACYYEHKTLLKIHRTQKHKLHYTYGSVISSGSKTMPLVDIIFHTAHIYNSI